MLATSQYKNFCLLLCCLKNGKIIKYKIIISPVVLYGSETWSLTLRQEYRLGIFCENRVLRSVFGPKKGEIIGD
jgi:hypothetical protein